MKIVLSAILAVAACVGIAGLSQIHDTLSERNARLQTLATTHVVQAPSAPAHSIVAEPRRLVLMPRFETGEPFPPARKPQPAEPAAILHLAPRF